MANVVDESYALENFWANSDCHRADFFRFLAISDDRKTNGDSVTGYSGSQNILADDGTKSVSYLTYFESELAGGQEDPATLASGVALAGVSAMMLAAASVF